MRAINAVVLILAFLGSSGALVAQLAPLDSTDRMAQVAGDSAEASLLKELREMLSPDSSATRQVLPSGSGLQGRRSLNPDISVVGSFGTAATEKEAVGRALDTGLSEAEISFQGYVDPYSRADFYVAFRRESEDPFHGPDPEAAANAAYEAELEEAYLTLLSLPFGLQARAGKFRSKIGKINQTHPHALNFLDLPRMYINYLGGEGLSDRGAGVSWLIPNPLDFFQELTVEVTSGALDGPSFSGADNQLLYLAHLKNFFDISSNSTFELGIGGIQGANDETGNITRIGVIDLTYRWKPLQHNRLKSLEWLAEALISNRETAGGSMTSRAGFTHLQYQIAPRWFLGTRFDYSEFPERHSASDKAYSLNLNFFASEFQKVELQIQHGVPADGETFNRVLLRAVFVIGAHGAHQY